VWRRVAVYILRCWRAYDCATFPRNELTAGVYSHWSHDRLARIFKQMTSVDIGMETIQKSMESHWNRLKISMKVSKKKSIWWIYVFDCTKLHKFTPEMSGVKSPEAILATLHMQQSEIAAGVKLQKGIWGYQVSAPLQKKLKYAVVKCYWWISVWTMEMVSIDLTLEANPLMLPSIENSLRSCRLTNANPFTLSSSSQGVTMCTSIHS